MTFVEDVADAIKTAMPAAEVGILTPTNDPPVVMVNTGGRVFVVMAEELTNG